MAAPDGREWLTPEQMMTSLRDEGVMRVLTKRVWWDADAVAADTTFQGDLLDQMLWRFERFGYNDDLMRARMMELICWAASQGKTPGIAVQYRDLLAYADDANVLRHFDFDANCLILTPNESKADEVQARMLANFLERAHASVKAVEGTNL